MQEPEKEERREKLMIDMEKDFCLSHYVERKKKLTWNWILPNEKSVLIFLFLFKISFIQYILVLFLLQS